MNTNNISDFNLNLLSELVGIILGDGHLHTTANRITIVGSLEDLYWKRFGHCIPHSNLGFRLNALDLNSANISQ